MARESKVLSSPVELPCKGFSTANSANPCDPTSALETWQASSASFTAYLLPCTPGCLCSCQVCLSPGAIHVRGTGSPKAACADKNALNSVLQQHRLPSARIGALRERAVAVEGLCGGFCGVFSGSRSGLRSEHLGAAVQENSLREAKAQRKEAAEKAHTRCVFANGRLRVASLRSACCLPWGCWRLTCPSGPGAAGYFLVFAGLGAAGYLVVMLGLVLLPTCVHCWDSCCHLRVLKTSIYVLLGDGVLGTASLARVSPLATHSLTHSITHSVTYSHTLTT